MDWDKLKDPIDILEKLGSLILAVVVATVGGLYTCYQKQHDDREHTAEAQRETDRRTDEQKRAAAELEWDKTKKRYENLTTLIPLVTSDKPQQVTLGTQIFISEANNGQAPEDLKDILKTQQQSSPEAVEAVKALNGQRARECKFNPSGIYIHVANDPKQLEAGKKLETLVAQSGGLPGVQGVQRVAALPSHTQLRYYESPQNEQMARRISTRLMSLGLKTVQLQNLSLLYPPPQGCDPPAIFELWIGAGSPLSASGVPVSGG